MFSCVVPVKGPRPYMEEALDSLVAQKAGKELEIIIQDGDVEPDRGQSDALNRGFAKAKGEWLFWLNADDVLLPGALECVDGLLQKVDKNRLRWIAGNTKYIDLGGMIINVRKDARWYPWLGRHLSVWTGGPSAFFHRDLWEQLGTFDNTFRFMMDIDLWTRWAKAGQRFTVVDEYVWGFRVHQGSLTSGGKYELERYAERKHLWEKHGLRRQYFWRNLTRFVQLMDGSWFRRKWDSHIMRGTHWRLGGK